MAAPSVWHVTHLGLSNYDFLRPFLENLATPFEQKNEKRHLPFSLSILANNWQVFYLFYSLHVNFGQNLTYRSKTVIFLAFLSTWAILVIFSQFVAILVLFSHFDYFGSFGALIAIIWSFFAFWALVDFLFGAILKNAFKHTTLDSWVHNHIIIIIITSLHAGDSSASCDLQPVPPAIPPSEATAAVTFFR